MTSEAELAAVARVLAEATGVSLAGGLDAALRDGLAAAATMLGDRPDGIVRRVLARDPEALAALVEHAVVGETSFWRHPEQLEALGCIAAANAAPLAIWSAGCATGEEPYSVAIALLQAGRAGKGDRILATDVSARALQIARVAAYGSRALRRLPPPVAARWFEGGGERRLRSEVRDLVTFARHNLVAEPAPHGGPYDVVLCRNVLIYFDPTAAVSVMYRLANAVRPGGVLVLGPVELPLAVALHFEWFEAAGATLLRRPVEP